jgi:capsular polysaccharide biosynthesis protein
MDPLAVLTTLWRQKWYVLPALVIAIVAAGAVFLYGPRTYQATASYALVNPQVPTDAQILKDPALGLLNDNNPYLRASDPSLIVDVMITRLSATETADTLKSMGLSTNYTVTQGSNGAGFIIDITGEGKSPAAAMAATRALGSVLVKQLHTVQEVNGADARFLYTSLVVAPADQATEQFSSRLRAVIIVAVAGVVLIFGAVSLGRGIDAMRRRHRANRTGGPHPGARHGAQERTRAGSPRLRDPRVRATTAKARAGGVEEHDSHQLVDR